MAFLKMYKIIITLLLCCCATAYGAEVDNNLLKKNLEVANLQIEVLKAQIEVMKSYQDRFLNIVIWSLGLVISVFSLMAGFNWFTNNRNAEKEAALNKEMIRNDLTSIENNMSQYLVNLKKEAKIILEAELAEKFTKQIEDIRYEQVIIKRELLDIEYEKWMTSGVFVNAMNVAADILEISNSDYLVLKAFEKINRVLSEMKHKNKSDCLSAFDKSYLSKKMKPYRENYNLIIEKIERQLAGDEKTKA